MEPVSVVGREYSLELLMATESPRSVTELSSSLNIPIATCYRRIRDLTAVGLIEAHGKDGSGSHKATLYRRTADGVSIRFDSMSFAAWTYLSESQSESPPSRAAETIHPQGNSVAVPTVVSESPTTEASKRQEQFSNDI